MPIVDDIELFESLGYSEHARPIHESGDPSFFYVLTDGGHVQGRIGVVAEESCPSHLRDRLPAREYRMFSPVLPPPDNAPRLVREVLGSLPSSISPYVDVILNPELQSDVDDARAAFVRAGMELFQEKHGYHWDDPGEPVEVSDRLVFATIDGVGDREYADIIGRAGEGTLDRNDRWYRDQTGPVNWGEVFVTFATEEDRDTWLVGYDRAGHVVGFVAVSDIGDSDPTEWDRMPAATVVMMGVLPEHRGNGYVHDLLAAGTCAAQRKGFVSMIDTVDVLNAPMDAAMVRGGHRRGARPWHVWHYRAWL